MSPSAITGAVTEIQPHQCLIGGSQRISGPLADRKALTLQHLPSIRAPMAAGAIPPPLFFERRRQLGLFVGPAMAFSGTRFKTTSVDHSIERPARIQPSRTVTARRTIETMANTTSAKKATRKIARRTTINKSRRTQMRGAVRQVEEALKRGDRDAAVKAMVHAEPELMQAAQRRIIHKNSASRKVSRLAHQIAKLAK